MAPKTKYNKKQAAEDTDSSVKETSGAWHNARTDCQNSDDEYDKKLSSSWKRDKSKGHATKKKDGEEDDD